ncbi:hypothetical protein B0J14DRAFT_611145 [Halenospora varia]|nr:hypothetical protein B0J14DRAFT_611145 [Halenospora varia]
MRLLDVLVYWLYWAIAVHAQQAPLSPCAVRPHLHLSMLNARTPDHVASLDPCQIGTGAQDIVCSDKMNRCP